MKYNQPFGEPSPDAPYINGNPTTGTMGSIPPAASIEYPQREIVDLISRGGIIPDNADLGQMTRSVQQGKINYAPATGTANALIAGLNPTPHLVDGFRLFLRFTQVNTDIITLDLGDGTGPHPVHHIDDTELNPYECYPGEIAGLVFNGGVWQMQVSSQQSTAENLIINPEFQVDQRNTFYAGPSRTIPEGGFTVDRWRAPMGFGPIDITQVNYGFHLNAGGSIEQAIEYPNLGGERVTVCVENPSVNVLVTLTDGGPNTVTGVINAGVGLRWVTLVVPTAIGPISNLICRFTLGSAGQFFRPQLLRGSQPKRFVRRPLRLEALLCFGYYWWPGRTSNSEVNVNPGSVVGRHCGHGIAISATQAIISIPLPVRMFKTPTLFYAAGTELALTNGVFAELPVTNLIAHPGMCRDVGVVIAQVASGLTIGQSVFLQWKSAAAGGGGSGRFEFDGEL